MHGNFVILLNTNTDTNSAEVLAKPFSFHLIKKLETRKTQVFLTGTYFSGIADILEQIETIAVSFLMLWLLFCLLTSSLVGW